MSECLSSVPRSARQLHYCRNFLIGFAIALIFAIFGILSRLHNRAGLSKDAAAALTTVTVVKPIHNMAGEDLVLPGSVQAYIEAPIYARTNGYLKKWFTDIGTRVKKGQLLANIETPEVDQQLRQAEADLATAQANQMLADTTNLRWQKLLSTDSVSKQDADEKAGDAAAKKAITESAAANVARLRALESFKRVVAPFDGVITARDTDIGALINSGQTGSELFRVADIHELRIYVQVPQPYAALTTPNLRADLRFIEHPGRNYSAQLVRTANALDPNTRTLQVELRMDNRKGELFPGAYADVHFKLPANTQSLRLPANTVLFRSAGLQVATVSSGNRVVLKNILEGHDFGSTIEVLSGISVDDNIVLNPPDSIANGDPVRIVEPPQKSAP